MNKIRMLLMVILIFITSTTFAADPYIKIHMGENNPNGKIAEFNTAVSASSLYIVRIVKTYNCGVEEYDDTFLLKNKLPQYKGWEVVIQKNNHYNTILLKVIGRICGI